MKSIKDLTREKPIIFQLDKINNILVLMPDKHMGNLVVSIPAIVALQELYHDKTFCLMVDSAYSEIVENLSGINQLVYYPRQQLRSSSIINQSACFLKFIRKLRSFKPDIAIDLEGRELSSTLSFLSGAPLRVGSATGRRSFFYNRKARLRSGSHRVFTYFDIASAVGAESRLEEHYLKTSEKKAHSLKRLLLNKGIAVERPIACIHSGAGKLYKQWSSSKFIHIADWLVDKEFQVVFIGSKEESEKNDTVISRMKNNAFNVAGELSLGELMSLFKISSLYIGNDSGPMHIAAAMKTPVVALFGSANENRWGPLTKRSVVLRGEEPCQRCNGNDCEYGFKCVRSIQTDSVKTAIKGLMNEVKGINEKKI